MTWLMCLGIHLLAHTSLTDECFSSNTLIFLEDIYSLHCHMRLVLNELWKMEGIYCLEKFTHNVLLRLHLHKFYSIVMFSGERRQEPGHKGEHGKFNKLS